jgi:hypothetical protein
VKCCGSDPRCRDCPARKIQDDRLLLALGITPEAAPPAHLRGVPRSLHKYEPIFRKAWMQRVEAASSTERPVVAEVSAER